MKREVQEAPFLWPLTSFPTFEAVYDPKICTEAPRETFTVFEGWLHPKHEMAQLKAPGQIRVLSRRHGGLQANSLLGGGCLGELGANVIFLGKPRKVTVSAPGKLCACHPAHSGRPGGERLETPHGPAAVGEILVAAPQLRQIGGILTMAILCENCKSFKYTCDPQMSQVCFGHCRAMEYPFLLGVSKEARPGAFTPPTHCKFFQDKEKVG
jgi:hypothetical protein